LLNKEELVLTWLTIISYTLIGILFQVILVQCKVTFKCSDSSAKGDRDLVYVKKDDVYTLSFVQTLKGLIFVIITFNLVSY
jgi:hypothetical protein